MMAKNREYRLTKTEARLLRQAESGDHTIEGRLEHRMATRLRTRGLARLRYTRSMGETVAEIHITGEGRSTLEAQQ